MSSIIFKNAITADSDFKKKCDILVEDGIIKKISHSIKPYNNIQVVDLKGSYIFAAFIDPHCHFEMQTSLAKTSDSFESGSKTLVWGGNCIFGDFTDGDEPDVAIDLKARISKVGKTYCDYFFHSVLKKIKDEKELRERVESLCEMGVKSVKIFTTYRLRGMEFPSQLLPHLFYLASKKSFTVCVHAEDEDIINYNIYTNFKKKYPIAYHDIIRDEFSENYAVMKILKLNELFGAQIYFVHISSFKSLEMINNYREKGYSVYAEVCPQYLVFDNSYYKRKDAYLFTFTPPLRSPQNKKLLINNLRYFHSVGSDSCAFSRKDKERFKNELMKIPMGISSAGLTASVIYTVGVESGRIKPSEMEKILSSNPADIFGLKRRGRIKEGYFADICVFDPSCEFVVRNDMLPTLSDYSCYEGMKLKGRVKMLYIRGKKVFENGKFFDEFCGSYLRTKSL